MTTKKTSGQGSTKRDAAGASEGAAENSIAAGCCVAHASTTPSRLYDAAHSHSDLGKDARANPAERMSHTPATSGCLKPEMFKDLDEATLRRRLQEEERALSECTPSEQLYLLHDLRRYQIELEIQNRELHAMRSELETARDRYASLYDDAPIGYLTLDHNGIIRQFNRTAARLLGYNEASIKDQLLLNLLDQADKNRFLIYLKRVFEGEETMVTDEFHLRAVTGEMINASLKSIPIREADTGDLECRMAVIDLTQQRHAEAEAEANRDALAHATRVNKLGEMSSGIVHELSQPISAIITYAGVLNDLLESGGDKQDKKRIAQKINDQAERSITLLKQLRDFSTSRPLNKSFQSMARLVDNAFGLIGNKLRNSGIRIVMRADHSLPPVFVDDLQITQVLINLLSNAVEAQANCQTQGQVFIRIHQLDRHRLQVCVRDSGPGVPPAMANQLFMPFRTTKNSGLGIGLSLSRSIIEAHHGKIWLDTRYSRGAAFCFTVPLQESEHDE